MVKKTKNKVVRKIVKKTAKKAVSAKSRKKVTAKIDKEVVAKIVKNKMSKKDAKIFKALLIKEREKLSGELSHISQNMLNRSQRESSGDLSAYSYHMADVASDNYEMEFSLGRATEEQKLLFMIDEALGRIEDGTYGICLGCNKPIAKKRLKALPQALTCIECQKKSEVR